MENNCKILTRDEAAERLAGLIGKTVVYLDEATDQETTGKVEAVISNNDGTITVQLEK